jgi:hypothetical protein
MSITSVVRRICELQPKWTSKNTPEMKERGVLVRKDLVQALRIHEVQFKEALGRYSYDWDMYGRDGSGPKSEAPWVRVYSERMSPTATEGFYMVIHFAADGSAVFVTVGHGSNNWQPDGSLSPYRRNELAAIVARGRKILNDTYGSMAPFLDEISLGAKNAGPENFERATVCAKRVPIDQLTDDLFVDYVVRALEMLSVIYEAVALGAGQNAAELGERDADYLNNPLKRPKAGQGFGASAADRKAIEICAMEQANLWLKANAFTEIKDCSGSQSYDFSASRESVDWKIEVKGTTADNGDAILMTANEVELHRNERGSTVIVIVSGIRLDRSGPTPRATGGVIWVEIGWDIDKWVQTPTAFRVERVS